MTDNTDGRDPDLYAAGQIVGHASDEDAGADIGVSVGLGQGRMLYFGEVSDKLLAECGATGLGGTGGWWAVVYGQDAQATQVLGKLAPGSDAQGIACTVASFVQPASAPNDLSEAVARAMAAASGYDPDQAWKMFKTHAGRFIADPADPIARFTAERDEAQRDHTDMTWQRRRAEERAEVAEARCDRLLIALHDAIRRPLGVTPDSGAEFYNACMADEAEERRASLTDDQRKRECTEERLRAENVKLRAERDAMRKALKACEDAAMSATYGPPSGWPALGRYPRGWRHPPGWPADRRPTPEEACWHDNGVLHARLAVRGIVALALGESALAQAGRAETDRAEREERGDG